MSLLEITNLRAAYEDGVEVLHGIDLSIDAGEFITLIGGNGAGKTTTLRAITGLLRPSAGSIRLDGSEIAGLPTAEIARLGIALAPEGRGIFPGLTVYENLRVAATRWIGRHQRFETELSRIYALFPDLAERRSQYGWSLSGGQQQMLAIGRALIARPRVMLLDEPSLGLAPLLVEQVFATLKLINEQGVAIMLVEQNAFMALEVSHRGYVIERGAIAMWNTAAALIEDERIKTVYLGG
jgi:branched-chain amino acid transport system ATP-binding protein